MLVRYKVSGRDEVVERVVERAAAVGAPLAELKAHLAATLGPGFWLSANTLQHCSQIADAARIDCVHPHGECAPSGKTRAAIPGPAVPHQHAPAAAVGTQVAASSARSFSRCLPAPAAAAPPPGCGR